MLFLFGLIYCVNNSFCAEPDSIKTTFSVGITGGLSQNNSFFGDVYGGVKLVPISKNIDVNVGYSVFSNKTSYRGVDNLLFTSHGLFVEGNYFLIGGLYGGLRFSVNFNWIDPDSQKQFEYYPNIDSPTFFSGIAGYGQVGYYHPIKKFIGIKLQLQIGLHNYKISEGWLLYDNSSSDIRNMQFGIERHAEFLYNLGVGFVFKL